MLYTIDMNYLIVEVVWLDACRGEGWTDLLEVKKSKLSYIYTVGYLLADEKDRIIVTKSVDEENETSGSYIVIPKINIKSRRTLK